MASLDKAFIKAYRQHDPAASAIPLDTSGTQSLVEALEDRPLREAKKQTAAARHDGVLAALETERLQPKYPQVVNRPSEKPAPGAEADDSESEAYDGELPSFLRCSGVPCGSAAPSAAAVDFSGTLQTERTARIDPGPNAAGRQTQVVPSPHVDPKAASSAPIVNEPAKTSGPTVAAKEADSMPDDDTDGGQSPDSAVYEDMAATPESEDSEPGLFRPVLQVDWVSASAVGERLQQKAATELNHLADALLDLGREGRKTVWFASDRPGQGTTTLLSCVALQLAQRGERVAMVDANLANPRLAPELGLLPEYGWERMLTDPMPLEELVVESVQQPIALLPLCSACEAASVAGDFDVFREAVRRLREHYGLVLVDLGVPDVSVIGTMVSVLDSVLLVRDVRRTQSDRVFGLHRALSRAGVNVAGMIESFVRGG